MSDVSLPPLIDAEGANDFLPPDIPTNIPTPPLDFSSQDDPPTLDFSSQGEPPPLDFSSQGDPPQGAEVLTPTKQEPSIFGRISGRFLGIDVDDPLAYARMSSVMVGGIGMAILGGKTPTFPLPVGFVVNPLTGAIVMGAVGTVIGAVAPETAMEIGEATGVVPEGTRAKLGLSPEDLRTVAEGEVLLDLFTAGGFTGARLFGRGVSKLLTGAGSKEARMIAEAGAKHNIFLMPVQVGSRTIARGYVTIMGRFPFIGSAFKKVGQAAEDAVRKAFEALPARVAPVAITTELGEQIFQEARGFFRAFGETMGAKYEAVFAQADELGILVVPRITLEKADEIIKKIAVAVPRAGPGKEAIEAGTAVGPVIKFIEESVLAMRGAKDGVTLTAKQSLRQMDGLISKIDQQIASTEPGQRKFAAALLVQLKQAAQADMLLNIRGIGGDGIAATLKQLDQDFSHAMSELFETTAAKRFGRVRRRGLKGMTLDEATATPVDQLARIVTNIQSPHAMEELSRLIEPSTFNRIVANVFDNATTVASRSKDGAPGFDVDVFADVLGLSRKIGDKRATLAKMLQLSGSSLTMDHLDELVLVGRQIASLEIPDMAAFIARRGVMGGLQTILNAVIPGIGLVGAGAGASAIGGSLLGIITMVGGGRLISAIIANPEASRALIKVLDKEAIRLVRRQLTLDVIRMGLALMQHEGTIPRADFPTLVQFSKDALDALDAQLDALGQKIFPEE